MALRLAYLADVLRAAGLTVAEHDGWKTRSMPSSNDYHPVGIINHHTVGESILYNYPNPPFWRPSSLESKCNITIQPNGVVIPVNAGYAYDSGMGSPYILDVVRNDRPLPSLGGLSSTINGNPWFVDIEVQHLGDGSPIDPRQYDALIRTNAAICEHEGWDPATRVIGHREWAPDRKVDPRWNGLGNPMPAIRQDTQELNMILSIKDQEDLKDWLERLRAAGSNVAYISYLIPELKLGLINSRELAAAIKAAESDADVEAVIDEIVSRLQG